MDEDEEFDDLLRQGLRPRQAPPGFTARVITSLPETRKAARFEKKRVWLIPLMRWVTLRWVAVTVLLGLAGSSYWQQQRQQRIAGEHARDQLMLALRLSAATLNDVQHKVMRSNKGDME